MSFKDIGFAGLGFVAPPAIEGMIRGFLPAALTANPIGKYAVKGGIVAGLSLIGGKFLGREAGKYIAIGGMTYLVANLVVDYVPQLFGGFGAYMNPGQVFRPARVGSRMGGQPLLGMYQGMGTSAANAGVPDRLNPAGRF